MSIAVSASSLRKSYWIPAGRAAEDRSWWSRVRALARSQPRMEIRALDDVSFEVAEGEVLGVIGRNGAGKSTLLKILSRITSPTHGIVRMKGHVASLLEVGTGFHPDLTGRENVYLNGMLLGMSTRAVNAVFDQVVEFAGVESYIDVPIKRYSSGMQLRLAFAVAAHLAADTMIIDEVLAVGDAEFQRKCLGAMRDVGRGGRTTLFVSHNMSAVESLCTRVMWLAKGRVRQIGPAASVIREYLSASVGRSLDTPARLELGDASRGSWTLGMARIRSVAFERVVREGHELMPWHVGFGEPFRVRVELGMERSVPDMVVGIGIRNDRGEDVLTSHSTDRQGTGISRDARALAATVHIRDPWLLPGTYYLEIALLSGMQLLDHLPEVVTLVVAEHSATDAPSLGIKKGNVAPLWTWQLE